MIKMRNYHYLLVLFILVGCSNTPEPNIYEQFKAAPLKQLVYQVEDFERDTIYSYTIKVNLDDRSVLVYHRIPQKEGKDLESFGKMEQAPDSLQEFWCTSLTFDLQTDSLLYLDTIKRTLGMIKQFEVEGQSYQVLKQPQWVFSKSMKPNLFQFYTPNYGLLCSLTKQDKTSISHFVDEEIDPTLMALLKQIEADKDFFNMNLSQHQQQ